jgi:YbgC/YbaW family acyl-CoA thioester hydrolase
MVRRLVSREFLWRAPVWQADLDAFGDVRNVSLLRLLQEAATRASTDAGFDTSYYDRTGLMWLVRRTGVTLMSPARYGDELTVRTWIADFRRVRSQREYEVRAEDRMVARAFSDWVFVDRTTGRPRRIPEEWHTTFAADGMPPVERTKFPEASPPNGAMTRTRRIEVHELDALRHVNNSNYVAHLEQAALDLLESVDVPFAMQSAARGRFRAVGHDLEYLDAALYGETIGVTVWPTEVTEHEVELHVHLHRGDARRPILQARSRYAWTTTNGPVAMPVTLRESLATP